MSSPDWDDDLADLCAFIEVARQDAAEPGSREALRAVADNCDRDGVLACALKIITELISDIGMCPECFREYAARVIVRA